MEQNEAANSGREMTKEELEQHQKDQVELLRQYALVNSVKPSGIFMFHTQFDMVRQFHVGARGRGNCYIGSLAKRPPLEILFNRCNILQEEFSEEGGFGFLRKLATGEIPITLENLVILSDWLVDLDYYLKGLAVNLGLPYDSIFQHIHQKNMEKVIISGGPKFREDGKVLKPAGWEGPEKGIFELIKNQFSEDTVIDPHQLPQGKK